MARMKRVKSEDEEDETMGKQTTNQWGQEIHLVHTHRDVSTHPHMSVFCVTYSTMAAFSSGWDMILSDLNSPQEEKTLCHDARISQNLSTGLYPARWKTVTGSQGPTEGQQDRGKGKLAPSADEQETFLSIAAKRTLFINIQSVPKIP